VDPPQLPLLEEDLFLARPEQALLLERVEDVPVVDVEPVLINRSS